MGVVDRALVDALRGDVGEAVEEGLARDAYPVEPDASVVHAVEAHLAAVVLDGDARGALAAGPDRHDERVHALARAVDLQLGEHDSQFSVTGRVADVVLARLVALGGDDELLGGGVVPRDGAERLHVGAVSGLGHREAAHQLPGDQVGQIGVVVAFGAQVQDRAAEEAELHADLDEHRQIAERQRLERGDRGPDVPAPAVPGGEPHTGLARRRHLDHPFAHPLAERVDVELLGLVEDRGVGHQVGPDQVADLGVLAVQQRAERLDVDLRLHVSGGRGRCSVSGHTVSLPHPGTIKQVPAAGGGRRTCPAARRTGEDPAGARRTARRAARCAVRGEGRTAGGVSSSGQCPVRHRSRPAG